MSQLLEQHRRRHTADGVLRGSIQKGATIDATVNVGIEQDEQILVEIVRGLAFHGSFLVMV